MSQQQKTENPKVGRPTFELTDEKLKKIYILSKKLAKEAAIARAIGTHPCFFCELKKRYPQMQEQIDQGRYDAESLLLDYSWDIIDDPKDKNRVHEMDRMYSRLGNKPLTTDEERDDNDNFDGYDIEVIQKEKPLEVVCLEPVLLEEDKKMLKIYTDKKTA